MTTLNGPIKNRRGTAAAWTSADPTLTEGEIGFETDTNKIKIGDGTTAWTALAYFTGGGAGTGDLVSTNNLSDVASAATSRTNLGLAIGTDVQAYSAVLAATTASFLTADESKLDAIEAGADVTDTTNVTAAGALMDSEVDADLKTLLLPANTTITAAAATVLDDATVGAMLTTLGGIADVVDDTTPTLRRHARRQRQEHRESRCRGGTGQHGRHDRRRPKPSTRRCTGCMTDDGSELHVHVLQPGTVR